uniref:TPM domain-containing protein n=1 Tax=Panagrolaimus davidi TaxID=227884 RepID=A0A914QD84_9BILA
MRFLINSFIFIFFIQSGIGVEWDSENYPNPVIDFEKCEMNVSSQICDPDKVFTVDDRIIIEEKLKWLENKTSKNGSRNCDGMGLFAVTIIGKHFKGGNSDSLKAIANDLISKWSSNNYCKKLIIIAFASDDRKVWITGDSGVQIECKKYTEIFEDQKSLFQKGTFTQAILNIIDALESAKDGSKGLSAYALAGIIIGIGFALFLCALCCKHFCPGDGSSTTSGNGDYGYGGGDGGDCGGGGGGF